MLKVQSLFRVLSVAAVLGIFCDARTSEKLMVQLPDGSRILGRYLTSLAGKGIRAFMGVPYAEPPIGELRFKVIRRKQIEVILDA